jgi:hypothetical protein
MENADCIEWYAKAGYLTANVRRGAQRNSALIRDISSEFICAFRVAQYDGRFTTCFERSTNNEVTFCDKHSVRFEIVGLCGFALRNGIELPFAPTKRVQPIVGRIVNFNNHWKLI